MFLAKAIPDVSRPGKRAGKWPALLALAALLVSCAVAHAQGFERVSLPIPVDIEGQPVHCPLYLKVEMKTIGQPLDKFSAGQLDESQRMFATALQALRGKDAAKFASVWASPNQMAAAGSEMVALKDNTAEGWMKAFGSLFDFSNVTVIAQVQVGSQPMLVWQASAANTPQRRAFYVGPDKTGHQRLSIVSSATPIEGILLNSFVAALTSPDLYKPVPSLNLRYQYPIPLEGKGNAGAHPVFFEFDGAPMDFPIANEKIKPPSAVLAFVRQASVAYDAGKYAEFTAYFTSRSQSKVRQWIGAMERQREQQKAKAASSTATTAIPASLVPVGGGNVKFVIDADPLFLVFQAPGIGSNWTSDKLTYSYLLRQESSFKIANFGYSSFLDDFLQNPALFDKRILKPVPLKPGAAKLKPAPAPARPVAAKH
jgi:hypothetical protein